MSQEIWWNKKEQRNMQYMGTRNRWSKCNDEFIKICKMSQKQLKNYLIMFLYEVGYKDVVVGDGFAYAKGDIPFCLTAHMDTVHKETVKVVYEYQHKGDYLISSPQGIGGDDRCGIYMICNILKKGFKPYIVFCEDEEIGCIGSQKFCNTNLIKEPEECKYIIALDRANANDAVFYDCDNHEFTEFITKTTGYEEKFGSCSDISYLCPECGVAGVNFSCGYYNAHTVGEYVSMNEMARTQEVVEKLLNTECLDYEYIEKAYSRNMYGYNWYDEYLATVNKRTETKTETTETTRKYCSPSYDCTCNLEIELHDGKVMYTQGESFEEAWVEFFFNNPEYCFNNVMNYEEYWC